MQFYSKRLAKILYLLPGHKYGLFRFLPLFFVMGAALEFTMIHLDVRGQVNFYRTYKRRQARELAEDILNSSKSS